MRWLVVCGLAINVLCCAITWWQGDAILPSVHVAMVCLCVGYLGGFWDAAIERWQHRN